MTPPQIDVDGAVSPALGPIDYRIFTELQRDGPTPITTLANELAVSEAYARKRVRYFTEADFFSPRAMRPGPMMSAPGRVGAIFASPRRTFILMALADSQTLKDLVTGPEECWKCPVQPTSLLVARANKALNIARGSPQGLLVSASDLQDSP